MENKVDSEIGGIEDSESEAGSTIKISSFEA